MLHVTEANYLGDFRILLKFNDGFTGIVDLAGRLSGPIFSPLNDVQQFRQFSLVGHTLSWANGADFAPEYLRGLAERPMPPEPPSHHMPSGEPSPQTQ